MAHGFLHSYCSFFKTIHLPGGPHNPARATPTMSNINVINVIGRLHPQHEMRLALGACISRHSA
jgi:hypothetical protein